MKIGCLILFIIVSAFNIFFEKRGNKIGKNLTKPFLMPVLLLFYLENVPNPNYLVVFALIFGCLGDVALMWRTPIGVLAGSCAFLIGHIFYILTFLQDFNIIKDVPVYFFSSIIIYIGVGILILKRLIPAMLPSARLMKVPSIIYLIIIFTMSFTSLLRIWNFSLLSFLFTFVGSIFFIISDTILAFYMFTDNKKNNRHYVMETYLIAQLFIIIGLIIK